MGIESQGETLRVDPSSLIGRADRNLVTPAGTAALTDAFRQGFVTTDDIVERLSERTKKKKELDLQLTNEALSPQAIQTRQLQQQAAGAAASGAVANAPLVQQAKEAELKAAIFDAQSKPGGFDSMQQALVKAGFPVAIDTKTGLTDSNKSEIQKRFAALVDYTQRRSDAEEKIKNTDTKFFPTEQVLADGTKTSGQVQKLFYQGQEISSDQFKSWAQQADSLRKTPFSSFYNLKSGEAIVSPAPTAPAPVIQPTVAPVTTSSNLLQQGFPVVTPNLTQEQAIAAQSNLVQPRQAVQPFVPTPAVQPAVTPQIGQNLPGIGIVTGTTSPSTATKPPTEAQQRALLALPRFEQANVALQDLQSRNYDPTSWTSWVDSFLPQIIKSGDRKEFETATSAWAQGLLRLESGAAISPKEESWYARTFFPQVNDPATVVKQKESLRHSVEAMVAEAGSAGPIPEDLKRRAQSVFDAAESFNKPGTPAVAGQPAAPATENTAVVGGQTYKVRVDPATGQRRYFIVR